MKSFLWVVCLIGLVLTVHDAQAQIKASEPGGLSQTIDGTVITIEYSRPSVRGRDRIFGAQVFWGEVWTPGANWATTIEFSKDVVMEGTPVPAGIYSMWMEVGRGNWDVILDTQAKKWHLPNLERTDDQIHFPVKPDTTAPAMETLVFYFPEIRPGGADLRFHWENTVVDMDIEVEPSQQLTVDEERAAAYTGEWMFHRVRPGMFGPEGDVSTKLTWDGGYMSTDLDLGEGMGQITFILAPASEQVFVPVWTINGQPASVIDGFFLEFVLDDDGRAVSFDARGSNDTVQVRGERLPE